MKFIAITTLWNMHKNICERDYNGSKSAKILAYFVHLGDQIDTRQS